MPKSKKKPMKFPNARRMIEETFQEYMRTTYVGIRLGPVQVQEIRRAWFASFGMVTTRLGETIAIEGKEASGKVMAAMWDEHNKFWAIEVQNHNMVIKEQNDGARKDTAKAEGESGGRVEGASRADGPREGADKAAEETGLQDPSGSSEESGETGSQSS